MEEYNYPKLSKVLQGNSVCWDLHRCPSLKAPAGTPEAPLSRRLASAEVCGASGWGLMVGGSGQAGGGWTLEIGGGDMQANQGVMVADG